MSTTSSTSPQLFQDFLGTLHYSRKFILHSPLPLTSPPVAAPPPSMEDIIAFDNSAFVVISVILCGVICSFGLSFVLRCALRCTNSLASASGVNLATSPANRGIKEKALKTFPVVNYSAEMKEKLPGLDTECIICLSEFESGGSLRLLPKCNHGFHVGCIDKWLKSHSSCPKCRQCLIETCQKIVGSDQASSSEAAPAVPESSVLIVPSEPEGRMCNFRGIN
ncbi:hypothetical protein SLE2022_299040 [Rubroshorea leprosula]